MVKEKTLENWIKQYLESIWAVVEWLQGWKIQVKKGWYTSWINLQKPWAPDLICLYKWKFFWIEVKKNQSEVDKWLKLEKRFNNDWYLPKSYIREQNQIIYKKHIINQCWYHITTCDIREVILFINDICKDG